MQEPYNEGLANHIGPESCGHTGNGMLEALTGEDAGWVLSRVSLYIIERSADAVENVGRQHRMSYYRERHSGLRAVEDPRHAWTLLAQELGDPLFGLRTHYPVVRTENPIGVLL